MAKSSILDPCPSMRIASLDIDKYKRPSNFKQGISTG